ncbi:MAG: hypothetical protein IJB02_02840 [Oscillospiraceae bacterium]|nr:hypothetical protein [Oscillospiraceae bacterium]
MLQYPYLIEGIPMPLPDQEVQMSFEDLDHADAGRDEAGFMHRLVARYKVGSWDFVYSHLTQQTYQQLLQLLPQSGSFVFSYPDPMNPDQYKHTVAYLSRYGITWRNAATGLYRNLKFSIIEC